MKTNQLSYRYCFTNLPSTAVLDIRHAPKVRYDLCFPYPLERSGNVGLGRKIRSVSVLVDGGKSLGLKVRGPNGMLIYA